MTNQVHTPIFDTVIVGGGAAGLSAALMLARSRRSVVVIDAGLPRNAPAEGVHGLLGREGMNPLELLAIGREEARGYGAEFVDGDVIDVSGHDGEFIVNLQNGDMLRGRKMLIATGLVDELPDIPGVREHWGRDVLHCPYCHGWEVRDRKIGVIATGPMSVHQALGFRQLSDRVTYFSQDTVLDADDRARLDALGIPIVPGKVAAVEARDNRIHGVRLAEDGTVVDLEVVIVSTRMIARTSVFEGIGIEATDHPTGAFIETDDFGATSVPGVWAAGNVSNLGAQVGAASAAGALAAQHMNSIMLMEEAEEKVANRAVPSQSEHEHTSAHTFDKEFWDQHWQAKADSAANHASNQPLNPYLVRESANLTPGMALDAGCGTGAESIWLASQGWKVTAVDISGTALDEARNRALSAELPDGSHRVEWHEADLETWEPDVLFDLVTTSYAHPVMPQLDFYERIGKWVAPGGSLLIVGHLHHHSHNHTNEPPEQSTTSAAAITANLDSADWRIEIAEECGRHVAIPGDRTVTLHDVIVRATKVAT